MKSHKLAVFWICASLLALPGCAFHEQYVEIQKSTPNAEPPTTTADKLARYDFDEWLKAKEIAVKANQYVFPDPAIVLSLSGGGTRAASFTIETIKQLQSKFEQGCAEAADAGERNCKFWDHVILISAVSGGGFTASSLLANPEILKNDVAFQQFQKFVLNQHLFSLAVKGFISPYYFLDRSQQVVDVFNEPQVLNHLTYGQLMRDPSKPFLLLNSSDIDAGRIFSFTQDRFDDLCADMEKLEVAVGVTASGNFPFALNGIQFKNYHATNNCNPVTSENEYTYQVSNNTLFDRLGEAKTDEFARTEARHRLYTRFSAPDGKWHSLPNYNHIKRDGLHEDNHADANGIPFWDSGRHVSYVHLFDGGITDNLGIRPVVSLLTEKLGRANGTKEQTNLAKIQSLKVKNVVVFQINARTESLPTNSNSRQSPTFITMFTNPASEAIDKTSDLSTYIATQRLGAPVCGDEGVTVSIPLSKIQKLTFENKTGVLSFVPLNKLKEQVSEIENGVSFFNIDADQILDIDVRETYKKLSTFSSMDAAENDGPTNSAKVKAAVDALFATHPPLVGMQSIVTNSAFRSAQCVGVVPQFSAPGTH